MNVPSYRQAILRLSFLLLILAAQPAFSADYLDNITEEYLRSEFTFGPQDTFKYSSCKKETYPSCTYVWGADSKKDAKRKEYGLAPDGNKLQVVYAQAKKPKDFQRVLATYSDAEKVTGVGAEAAWSKKRKQLSFITEENLIIHIHVDVKGNGNLKEKAVSIAKNVLDQL